MQAIANEQLNQVAAGHAASFSLLGKMGTAGIVALCVIEFVHVIEAYNYFADWTINGCGNVDSDDHFRRQVCQLVSSNNE